MRSTLRVCMPLIQRLRRDSRCSHSSVIPRLRHTLHTACSSIVVMIGVLSSQVTSLSMLNMLSGRPLVDSAAMTVLSFDSIGRIASKNTRGLSTAISSIRIKLHPWPRSVSGCRTGRGGSGGREKGRAGGKIMGVEK